MSTIAEYNVLDGLGPYPGLVPGGGSAGANTTNLQGMLYELLKISGPTGGLGGTLLFPPDNFAFNDTITVGVDSTGTPQPYPVILRCTGASQNSAPVLQFSNATDDFFKVNTESADCLGGVVFQDLVFSYTGSATAGVAAVRVNGAQNIRLFRCSFIDWPIAVGLTKSLQFNMMDCTVSTNLPTSIGFQCGTPMGSTSSIESYLAGNIFLGYGNGGGTGVLIYGCEHLRMTNCRIESFTNAIMISPSGTTASAEKLYFGNVSCFGSDTALTLSVAGGSEGNPTYISQAWFAQCEFEAGGGSTGTPGAGILIGPTDGNDVIDQIRFVDCHSCFWNGPGMNMQGGTNIEVIGGYYSCNGNGDNPTNPWAPSGIALSGPVSGVRISNAACNNSLYDIYLTPPALAPATQEYGIYVRDGATSVRINGCDLTGNTINGLLVDTTTPAPSNVFVRHCDFTGVSAPVSVNMANPIPSLQITNCPGYNDQNTPVATGGFTGNQHAAALGYFGPSVVTWYNTPAVSLTIILNGVDYTSNFGSIYLTSLDVFKFSPAAPSTITWIGK
jgi:hypothetical protein